MMNADAWKKHFLSMAEGKFRDRPFYSLANQRGGSEESKIQVVTPTQQAVEMAKSQIKRAAPKRKRQTKPNKKKKTKKRKKN